MRHPPPPPHLSCHHAPSILINYAQKHAEYYLTPVKCVPCVATSYMARNNFRIVSGHDDRPNSFLLGHVSFLAGQMYMMNYSFKAP